MPRSGEDARRRLQKAALDLYSEDGYDQTTTAQIAARAGVTERTFFRHFPDKREVMFEGAAIFAATLARGLDEASTDLPVLDALLCAFCSVEPIFEANRPYAGVRQRVIANTPALQERELAKGAALVAVLAEGLQRRGVEDRLASLAATVGMAAFNYAVIEWIKDPSQRLSTYIAGVFGDLAALSSIDRSSR